jgi:hypothetical protein
METDPYTPYEPNKNVRGSDPATSHAAAASIAADVTEVQRRVRAIHVEYPAGLTDEELLRKYIARYGPTAESSPRKRRHDLTVLGIIVDTGERRPLVSGRSGIVWGLKKRDIPTP